MEDAVTTTAEIAQEEVEEISKGAGFLKSFADNYLGKFAVDLVIAILIIVLGFVIAKLIKKGLAKSKLFGKLDPNIAELISNIICIGLKAIVIVTAIIKLGVPQSAVVAAIGSAGLALGLALQGGLGNLASGVVILICRPFHVGDFIVAGDISGTVKSIGAYYTVITAADNLEVTVPNSTVANATINNLSSANYRRVDFDFNVAYDTDIEKVRKVLLDVAKANEQVLTDPASEVLIAAHGTSALSARLRIYVEPANYWPVYFAMWEDVKKAFDANGITIPYSHMNVIVEKKAD